jgi:hypothetical protein
VLSKFPPRTGSLAEFVPFASDAGGSVRQLFAAEMQPFPRNDLFAAIDREATETFLSLETKERQVAVHGNAEFIIAFRISPSVVVTIDRRFAKPAPVQCFLAALRAKFAQNLGGIIGGALRPTAIWPDIGLVLWSTEPLHDASAITQLWLEITRGGELDHFEVSTTPKLYGSKERLTETSFRCLRCDLTSRRSGARLNGRNWHCLPHTCCSAPDNCQ